MSLFLSVISKISVQYYYRPIDFKGAEAPRFRDIRHMKVVRLSDLQAGRFYASGNIPGTHFC
jgi:hypothetical protein